MTDEHAPPESNAVEHGDEQNELTPSEHALSADDLQYPEFVFDEGSIAADGAFDLDRELDPEAMATWLTDLAGGIGSHDVAVEAPDRHVTFGIRPSDVSMSFAPDEDGLGQLEVTFTLDAKVMRTQDPTEPKLGARGGRGFIPIEMLTSDRDPEGFRCYNWVDDPTADE